MAFDIELIASSESPVDGAYRAAVLAGLAAAGAEAAPDDRSFRGRDGATGTLSLAANGARFGFVNASSAMCAAVYEAAAASHSLIRPHAGGPALYRTVGEIGKHPEPGVEVSLVAGASSLREALETPPEPALTRRPPAVPVTPPRPQPTLDGRVSRNAHATRGAVEAMDKPRYAVASSPTSLSGQAARKPKAGQATASVLSDVDQAAALRQAFDQWFPVGVRRLVSPLSKADVLERMAGVVGVGGAWEGAVTPQGFALRAKPNAGLGRKPNSLRGELRGAVSEVGGGSLIRLEGAVARSSATVAILVAVVAALGAGWLAFELLPGVIAGDFNGVLLLLLGWGAILGLRSLKQLRDARGGRSKDQLAMVELLKRLLQASEG